MAMVKTTIDGREIEVERDRWALDVAREMGIDIPTLCHHPAVEPYGACRLCVVEVTKGRWTWLTTSCDLPIREGLTIRTDSPAVLAARKMALELLWSSAPQAEAVADLARSMGLVRPRFADHNQRGKCILCGLCVRACRKVLGESAVCFAQRGEARHLTSPMDTPPEPCIGCRACVCVCPTGHIQSVDDGPLRRIDAFGAELELARCPSCGEPFAPARQVAHARALAGDGVTGLGTCTRCRRRQSVEKFQAALAATSRPIGRPQTK